MSQELVTITVNGRQAQVPKGMLLVEAAKYVDVEIPVFCYHPKLDPAGLCRMCLVEVEGQRKPVAACTMPVTDGMVVRTDTPVVQGLQRGVIEFLLLNHPLDCPVCDKGGECPLQDHTFRYGPVKGRSLDAKMRKPKAVNLGDFIVFDQERCILCRRCTRFDKEITQEDHLVVEERAHLAYVTTADGEPFNSYFAGNTIELCPVGALTSDIYRFRSRPWDLARTPSVCTGCSAGCNVHLDFRFGELLRIISRDNPELDNGWLCDRGRFNYRYVHSEERIRQPLLRKDGKFVPVSWDEALAEIGLKLRTLRRDHGGEAIGAIGGGRLSNEEAYLFQKLARAVWGTPNVDWRTGEQYVASSAEFPGRVADISRASGILLVDVLPAERIPVIDLRIRRAAERGQAVLAAVGPAMPKYRPAFKAFPALESEIPQVLASQELMELYQGHRRVVAVWSGRNPEVGEALVAFLRRLKEAGVEVHLLIPGEQTNAWGAEAMGMHPERLPGYASVADEEARRELEHAWQTRVPEGAGLDTTAMLKKAAAGELQALYLAGANLMATYPDRALVKKALERVPFLVVQDLFLTETAMHADVVLPVAAFSEKDGSFTALDGTVQAISQAAAPQGEARSDAAIFAAVAQAMGIKLYESKQELEWEIRRFAPWEGDDRLAGAPAEMVTVAYEQASVRKEQGKKEGLVLVPVERLYAGGGTAYFDVEFRRARPKAQAFLHPEDAKRLRIAAGDSVNLSANGASYEFEAVVEGAVVPGTVQVIKGLFEAPANAYEKEGRVAVSALKRIAEEVG